MLNWWFAMFSDHWYGDLGRSFGEGEFNVGRNTISLILPAVGVAFSIGGCGMLWPALNKVSFWGCVVGWFWGYRYRMCVWLLM